MIAKVAQGIEQGLQEELSTARGRYSKAFSAFLAAAWRTLSCPVSRDAMSDPFAAAELFVSIWIIRPGACLIIADDLDLGIEGGQAARPLGLCDAGHRAKGKPGLAGATPPALAMERGVSPAWRRSTLNARISCSHLRCCFGTLMTVHAYECSRL
ncbi:MAG: hypothetical protein ACREC0_10190 [Methylocella sp.]